MMTDQQYHAHIDRNHDGEWAEAEYDARGIYLCRACHKCRSRALRGYRPEVLTDPQYEANEQLEPED